MQPFLKNWAIMNKILFIHNFFDCNVFKKIFFQLKARKLQDFDVEVIHGEPLSAYTIQPVDMAKLMLKRARFEGLKPKQKKKKKDFGSVQQILLAYELSSLKSIRRFSEVCIFYVLSSTSNQPAKQSEEQGN